MTTQRELYGEAVYELRRGGTGWAEIYERFPDVPPASLRKLAHFERAERGELGDRDEAPRPFIEGITTDDDIDEDAVWQAALDASKRKQRREWLRQQQSIEFDHGPVALVFMADLHLGGAGVDYARLDGDISLVLDTPAMYVILVGDALDNFIVGRLQKLMNGAEFNIAEQWVLVKRVLGRLAPRLVAAVAGNHDLWTFGLSGVDYLREVHSDLNPGMLYHKYDLPLNVAVAGEERIVRVRHSWQGSSIYNPTHSIERASKFDQGRPFDIGVAAHTHVSGLVREFNNGGHTGLAVQCGSYKRYDDFSEAMGFPLANNAIAVTVVLEEDGMWGTGNLDVAARYMRRCYQRR